MAAVDLSYYDVLFSGMSDEKMRECIQHDRYMRTVLPEPKVRKKREKDVLREVLGELSEEELEEVKRRLGI